MELEQKLTSILVIQSYILFNRILKGSLYLHDYPFDQPT